MVRAFQSRMSSMLGFFRRMANTWVARVFFMILVAAFGLWGIGDVARNLGQRGNGVGTVGGQPVQMPELQDAYQRQLQQMTRMMGGGQPTPEIRRAAAEEALNRLVTQMAIGQEVERLGLQVPDDALRQAVFSIPAFHGPNGQFDRAAFQRVLASNNLTEPRFLELMRGDLGQRQLVEAVRVGAPAPGILNRQIFDFRQESRTASLTDLPFSAAPQPPAPTDAQLHRYYDDNPDAFRSPEYRRIHAIILSAETVARDMQIPDSDLHAYYDQHKSEFAAPEKRSAEIAVTQDEAAAQKVALQWRAGATWAQIQDATKQAGGTTAELDTAAEAEFPSPELGKAVFAAESGTVSGPVQTPLGWDTVLVTKVTPGTSRSFDEVKDQIRGQLAQSKAGDQVYDRANKIEDLLASGTRLQDLPADLGVAAVAGTLDKQGDTPSGQPAPIPASPSVKTALIAAAFQAKPGDPPQLTEVPGQNGAGSAYYAVSVDEITPAAQKPFEAVQAQVRDDWTAQARRHEQNEAATKVMTEVQGGKSLEDAARAAGLQVRQSPPVTRAPPPPEGVPAQLVQALFGLKKGEATMVETPDGFMVAQLTDITEPDPAKDPVGYGQLTQAVTHAEADDLELSFAIALRMRAKPQVNPQVIDQLAQP
jgi:peptidyl-prolyl cis-trans isomerase D